GPPAGGLTAGDGSPGAGRGGGPAGAPPPRPPVEEKPVTQTLDDATDAEIFDFIRRELGGPGGGEPFGETR
ncbi:hypothetical protein, partial [Micromonospora sp. NPDC001898]|uniref:hypothetical protein n=1 Tax=Micromonospora sp. NPDC001898 TaxID=3364221 RepID=UPI0036BE49B4